MSSKYVRDTIKAYIATVAPSYKVVDMTGEYREVKELLADKVIASGEVWIGIDFLKGQVIPITIGTNNTHGKYRETAGFNVQVNGIAKPGGADDAITLAQSIIDSIQVTRPGGIWIDSHETPADNGSGFNFEQGFITIDFTMRYIYDLDK